MATGVTTLCVCGCMSQTCKSGLEWDDVRGKRLCFLRLPRHRTQKNSDGDGGRRCTMLFVRPV